MQRENQQLRKTIDEMKHSGQRIIELKAENEQLQKATLEGKTTVYSLTEVRIKHKIEELVFLVKYNVDNFSNVSSYSNASLMPFPNVGSSIPFKISAFDTFPL